MALSARSGAASGLALVVFLGLSFAAAAIGGLWTASGVREWYPTIAKPSWTPDPSLIGLAWTILYPAIGVAGWLIWRAGVERSVALPLACWGVQMIANAAWSGAFFGLRSPGLGVVVIAVLWVSIAATAITAWPVAPMSSLIFVVYLAWVTFAGALNIAIWRLNNA